MTAIAAPLTLVDEPLSSFVTAAGNWTVGGSACLTSDGTASGSIPQCDPTNLAWPTPLDPAGSGVLRLTSPSESDSGFAFDNTVINASRGIQVSFDQYQWGGDGADGIAFFLIDGTVTPTSPGAPGGALGYADSIGVDPNTGQDALVPGIDGAVVGVGFDSYGNFSDVITAPNGALGPEQTPNSIVVRGSKAANYGYVRGVTASGSLAETAATERPLRQLHTVITISTSNIMSVAVSYAGSPAVTELRGVDLSTINGADALPATLKLGFAASTGLSNQFNEVGNVVVSTLAPDLTLSATMTVGDTDLDRVLTYEVTADAAAGSTNGTITFSSALPTGLTATSANGIGWDCGSAADLSAGVVTCTRPADGLDALVAGEDAPPITVRLAVPAGALDLRIPASVSLADDSEPSNNASTVRLMVASKPATIDDAGSDAASGTGGVSAITSRARSSGTGSSAGVSALAATGTDAGVFAVLADVFLATGVVLIAIALRRSRVRGSHRH